MRYKRKHGKFHRKPIKLLITLLIISTAIFTLFEFKARDLVHNTVENELEIHAMKAIDEAVAEVLSDEEIKYESLIVKTIADNGSVTSLSTDTASVNILKSHLSLRITDKIRRESYVRIGVPAGAFTGLVLLSSSGPDIHVSLNLNGSVTTSIKSQFVSAGINQTLHRLYLVVDADVSLTCPIINYETNIITEYELCNTVIVGSTPTVFADVS